MVSQQGGSPPPVVGTPVAAVLAVLPLWVLAVVSAVVVAGWLVGASPFFPPSDVTLSEAAAMRDDGQVVYLIEVEHKDPNRAWPVRAGLTNKRQMTPLEAAVAIQRLEMVTLLLRRGARVPEGDGRTRLICAAAAAPDIVAVLVAAGDSRDPRPECPALERR